MGSNLPPAPTKHMPLNFTLGLVLRAGGGGGGVTHFLKTPGYAGRSDPKSIP